MPVFHNSQRYVRIPSAYSISTPNHLRRFNGGHLARRPTVYVFTFSRSFARITMYQSCFWTRFSPAPVGLFSRSPLRGTQGARLYTTTQVWVPGALRGACSGHSKSRNLASKHGVAFHGAINKVEQDIENPTCQLLCSTVVKAFYSVAATVQQQSHGKFV